MYNDLAVVEESSRSDAPDIAKDWCRQKGAGWSLGGQLGSGGTAPVFEVTSPDGPRALKIYDQKFSTGELGEIEEARIEQQLNLRGHHCQSLVQVYEGGRIQGRLYLLMSRAPGTELQKRLRDVPRDRIRSIVHQVAEACIFLKQRGLCHRDVKAANIFVSEDFANSTLLDISVIRNVHDPIGVGTDREGQLPVLATARYSPPEYLFRLVEPSERVWQALTVYQLGALLHDLIVRTPLFQQEYEQSATNRYRFAWVVATKIPTVRAADVGKDLLFLASRALDKDWERRSMLQVEDFLDGSMQRRTHALQMLGIGRGGRARPAQDVTPHAHLDRVATRLEERLVGYFKDGGVTTKHEMLPGPHGDTSRFLQMTWETSATGEPVTVEFQLTLQLVVGQQGVCFCGAAKLTRTTASGRIQQVELMLPDTPDSDEGQAALADHATEAFEGLAGRVSDARVIVP
ncbi:MAG: protein kinase [Acidobacteria bacterium]|nr:protein kinase [Acidobacteriota bacterium]